MISALELKNKLESFDKNFPLLNYNIMFGFLPAIILFPLYLILTTTRTESAIIHSPIMFGAGFAGFFVMCLVFSTGSLMITYLALGRYIAAKDAVRRFNVNGILQDELIFRKMANGIWEYIKLHRKHDPLYQADLEQLNKKIDENKSEVNEKFEIFMREIRIKNLAIDKLTHQKIQAERERDQAKKEKNEVEKKLDQVSHELGKALKKIFQLEEIIRKLKGE